MGKLSTMNNQHIQPQEIAMQVNSNSVFAAYASGTFNAFYASEAAAMKHCENPNNGVEFNGEWIQDQFVEFAPGELYYHGDGTVYYRFDDALVQLDEAMGHWQVPFVKWIEAIHE